MTDHPMKTEDRAHLEFRSADRTRVPDLEPRAYNQMPKTNEHRDLKLYRYGDTDLYQWWSRKNGSVFEDPCDEPFLIIDAARQEGRCSPGDTGFEGLPERVTDQCGSRDEPAVCATAALTFKGTPGDWKVFDHYCGRDPETAGEYANTRLIGLSQFETIAEVRHGSDDIAGDVDANAALIAASKDLLDVARILASLESEDGGRRFPTKAEVAHARTIIARALGACQ